MSSPAQRRKTTVIFMCVVGLLYFGIFTIPNSLGASTNEILLNSSSDEYVLYPNVARMLTPGKTFNETRANIFFSDDYHYGYPFFALSALAVLPSRLLYGANFTNHLQLNMFLLRQLISVLPMILAAGLLVFLQTRFLSLVKSLGLFIFILTLRGVMRNQIWWWHPDALAVLAVVLTIFFLERDQLRFGRNFYFAAVACGMASAIKLLGFAFFLTIPVYIGVGLIKHHLNWSKAAIVSALFVLVMVGTIVISNPFLFSNQQRTRMLQIQAQKQEELSKGYEHDDPIYYSKGPQWWVSTLEKWYASPFMLLFMLVSLACGMVWGERRLLSLIIFTWILPYSIYLLYFVAVKPDHYWLPVMLPLFSGAFILIDLILARMMKAGETVVHLSLSLNKVILTGLILLLAWQFLFHLIRPVSGNIAIYASTMQRAAVQLQTVRH
jgi:hypothetical protein